MDKDLVLFHAEVIELAKQQFRASCSSPESRAFVESLYKEYQQAGKPNDVVSWLTSRMKREFVWVTEPPRWVEDEPAWAFFDGRPMVFIRQISLPANAVTKGCLTWDEELYLFGIRIPIQTARHQGFRMEYKVVSQNASIHGTGVR
jgi:hypothetical protein